MRRKKTDTRKLIGCLPLTEGGIGFAVPVFTSREDSRWTVQEIDELSERISAFRILEGFDTVLLPAASATASVGGSQVYAFVSSPASAAHVGPLHALRPTLEDFAKDNPDRRGIVVQIQELI